MCWPSGASGSGPHRFHQAWYPDESDGALEVVGEDVEAHLGSDVLHGTRLQVASAHPVLDGTEDVLDRSSTESHRAGLAVETCLHGLDDLLVFPALDPTLDAGGAVCLYGALGAAGGRGVTIEREAVLETSRSV